MAYSTSTDLSNLLSPIIGATDSLLTNTDFMNLALQNAQSIIDQFTHRDFLLHTNVIEFHDGNGRDNLNTYYFPIISLHYVVMYNQLMQSMRTFLDMELIIHPEWGELFLPPIYPVFLADKPFSAMFGNCFIQGRRNIEISYDYGYTTPPADIVQASNLLAGAYILKMKYANLSMGAGSRSIDGYSESFGAWKTSPFGSVADTWETNAKEIYQRYKRIIYRAV